MSILKSNPSFVLKAVNETVFEERPVPESETAILYSWSLQAATDDVSLVDPYDVLIEVKKTGDVSKAVQCRCSCTDVILGIR